MKWIRFFAAFAMVLGLSGPGATRPSAQQPVSAISSDMTLVPTNHPRFPSDASQLWMTPSKADMSRTAAVNAFVTAVGLEVEGNFTKALPTLSQPLLRDSPL